VQLETFMAPPGDLIVNHPHYPVLVYRGVDEAAAGADACRALFGEHGWGGAWTDGVFAFHHFHSNAHEVLGVVAGSATLALGGPQGEAFTVAAGDVLVLPAGTGHKREAASDDFLVVGAYPPGQENYDLRRGERHEADEARRAIARVALPPGDPVGGEGLAQWREPGGATGS
jgi:uncharacterized protein YjlB